jgi:hypothetical protein
MLTQLGPQSLGCSSEQAGQHSATLIASRCPVKGTWQRGHICQLLHCRQHPAILLAFVHLVHNQFQQLWGSIELCRDMHAGDMACDKG